MFSTVKETQSYLYSMNNNVSTVKETRLCRYGLN